MSKSFKTTSEMEERRKNWKKANREVRRNNAKSERSGRADAPFMDINQFSDWSEEEKERLLGLISSTRFEASRDDVEKAERR